MDHRHALVLAIAAAALLFALVSLGIAELVWRLLVAAITDEQRKRR